MDLKRTIRCSHCGNESNVSLSSDIDMKELLIAGKCTKCGSALQITYSLIEANSTSSNPLDSLSTQKEEPATLPDLEESLFSSPSGSEVDNDMLRDLMED